MLYDDKVINSIRELLVSRGQTVAVAESVTAGHLQAALSSAVEAAKFFQGGITAYNIGQKSRHLGVDPILAQSCDCVHQAVAQAMAKNVAVSFLSHYGLAITGYATPMPEEGVQTTYAYFAISMEGKIVLSEKLVTKKERIDAQLDYTVQVLARWQQYLLENQ